MLNPFHAKFASVNGALEKFLWYTLLHRHVTSAELSLSGSETNM